MRIGLLLVSFCLALLFSSCDREVSYRTEKYLDVFEVDVPNNFEKLIIKESFAGFQFGNQIDEFYLTISKEGVEDLSRIGLDYELDLYSKVCVDMTKSMLENPIVKEIDREVKINNNMQKKSYSLKGFHKMTSKSAFYYVTFYKSESNFYSILSWCMLADEIKYTESINRIHLSFKEL